MAASRVGPLRMLLQLVGAIAADAHEGGAAEDKTLAVVETMATTEVGPLAKTLKPVVPGRCLEGTWTGDIGGV